MATDLAEGKVVAMDVDASSLFGMEGAAADIWRLFATPRTPDEVVAALAGTYDVDPQQCRDETLGFIDTLVARQLLTAVD